MDKNQNQTNEAEKNPETYMEALNDCVNNHYFATVGCIICDPKKEKSNNA